MKVSVNISPDHTELCAVICTNHMTNKIQRIIDFFNAGETPITAQHNEELVILQSVGRKIYADIKSFVDQFVIYGQH